MPSGNGGLQHDQRVRLKAGGDRPSGAVEGSEIGALLRRQSHRHDDDHDVALPHGGGGIGRRAQAGRRHARRAMPSARPSSSGYGQSPRVHRSRRARRRCRSRSRAAPSRRTGRRAAGRSCPARRRRPRGRSLTASLRGSTSRDAARADSTSSEAISSAARPSSARHRRLLASPARRRRTPPAPAAAAPPSRPDRLRRRRRASAPRPRLRLRIEAHLLREVVGLEKALLAQDRQLAHLQRRQPVDVEDADGAVAKAQDARRACPRARC